MKGLQDGWYHRKFIHEWNGTHRVREDGVEVLFDFDIVIEGLVDVEVKVAFF